jgi:N4-gp56 family major capsid protein
MADAQTSSSALSAAITFKVQRGVLENLRADLVWADKSLAEVGTFDPGHDTLMFVAVPDITLNTTILTEGSRPEKRALTLSTVTVSTNQYGDLVAITDVAKVKSPIEIASIATERLSRQAAETLDQVARDVISAGGTTFLAPGGSNTVRSDIASNETITASMLRQLKTRMKKGKIMPKSDGFYVLFVHPNVSYDLRNENSSGVTVSGSWNDVNKYAGDVPNLIKGEVGRIEGFRVIEVINAPTFASTTTVYRSIALGDKKGWGCGDLQTLQAYHVAPGGDHTDPLAQEELMGWKVNYGCAVLSNSYYYGLETAATSV